MLRRQRRDSGGAAGIGCEIGGDSLVQNPSSTREIDEEQGERPEQLLGDRDAAKSLHGGCVRDHLLVRGKVQGVVQSPRGVESLALGISQEARRQIGNGLLRFLWGYCIRRSSRLN